MENDIKIITENNKIKIYTPFSYKFVEKIKDVGAQWNGSAWIIEKAFVSKHTKISKNSFPEHTEIIRQ